MTEWRLEFRGTLFPMRGGELTLGRSSYASIVVNNPLTSREHAVVRAVGGRVEIEDLGSKNGTFVNDKRITGPYRLEVGDRIKIGTDVIDVVRVSPGDPGRLRAITLPGKPTTRPEGAPEEETTEVSKRPD
ncbi:MAG TPA: FHA domain-containing protein [Polyangiaceae bacterium]|nr:FHA domain-containing protein [Polyangiaceae bacterium]